MIIFLTDHEALACRVHPAAPVDSNIHSDQHSLMAMTTGGSNGVGSAWQPHGHAVFRANGHGGRVVVIPTRCPSGLHALAKSGYRASEVDYPTGRFGRILRVSCAACRTIPRPDHAWTLMTGGQQADSAEFDDGPYATLLAELGRRD